MTSNSTSVALVTGAARRIGRAIALRLARDGFAVAVHYRASRDDAEAVVGECKAAGARAVAIAGDLADAGQLDALIAHCRDMLGPPTLLVNNASEFSFDSARTMTAESWDRHHAVNARAPVLLARSFAGQLPDSAVGVVVNIIDQRVWAPTPEFFSYTASKVALWGATRMLAQALAPRVRVNAVGPGPTLQGPHQTAAEFTAEAAATPLRRATSPTEVAAAVRFILDAPAMTGQMITLDGGQHLRWLAEAEPPPRTS